MKFCQPHWDKLRAAVDARGLTPFVPSNGEEATRRTAEQINGSEVARSNFDPLMMAHWAIASNAMAPELVTREAALHIIGGGDVCPLCFLNEAAVNDGCPHPNHFDNWIERAADDALAKARDLGLVASG